MQFQDRELALHMQGEDVQLLHVEPKQLGLDLPEAVVAKSFSGLRIDEAVKQFRPTHGLQPSAVLQEQAAAQSGEALQ